MPVRIPWGRQLPRAKVEALLCRRLPVRSRINPGARSGRPVDGSPPVLWDIDSNSTLADTKIIAEAWGRGRLYQVGSLIGDSWKEWDGRFRDDVRGFVRGEPGSVGHVADRFLGSPEIYGHKQREAGQSVNFVIGHDGFTLNDLVSYNNFPRPSWAVIIR